MKYAHRSLLVFCLLVVFGIVLAFAQPDQPVKLSEVETLRGQKVLLQIQLWDSQIQQLNTVRQQAADEFNRIQGEAVKAHAISLDTHYINWDTGEVIAKPAPKTEGGK